MNNLQHSLPENREFLSQQRDAFLKQCWEFLGLELESSYARTQAGPDKDAARDALYSWITRPEGWKHWGTDPHQDDPALDNLMRLLDELVRG